MLSSVGVFPSRNQSAFIFSIASLIASSSGERYRPVVATEACPMAACTTLTLISVRALTAKVCLSQWVDEARSLAASIGRSEATSSATSSRNFVSTTYSPLRVMGPCAFLPRPRLTRSGVSGSDPAYAASGGYYISCNADSIVADPTTLTGSIGIFGMFPNVKGLTDKIGLSFDVVKTNTYADFGAMGRPLNDGEKALMQNMVNEGYELFVKRCAEGRGMTTDEIKKIAEGRVWTGTKAKELGLVDELGGLDKALEIAIEKAGLDAYTVMSYPGKKSFFDMLTDTKPGGYIQSRILKGKVGELYNQFDWLNNFENCDKIQARVPFELNIN